MRRILQALILISILLGFGLGAAQADVRIDAELDPEGARLVFAWRAAASARLAQAGSTLRLRFSRPLAADLTAARTKLAGLVRSMRAGGQPGELVVELGEGVGAQMVLESAERIVLRLSRKHGSRGAARERDTPSAALHIRSGRHEAFGRLVLESGLPFSVDIERHEDRLSIRAVRGEPLRTGDVASIRALRPWITETVEDRGTLHLKLAAGTVHRAHQAGPTRWILDLASPKPTSRPVPIAMPVPAPRLDAPGKADAGQAAAAQPLSEPAAPIPSPDPEPPAAAAPAREALRLVWRRPVSAAIFERAGVVWLAFGARREDLLRIDRPATEPAAWRELIPLETSDLYVLRLAGSLPRGWHARRDGPSWALERADPSRALGSVPVEHDRNGLVLPGQGTLAAIEDPDSGETLHLLLAERPELRMSAPLTLVDLDLLPTAAGFAWRVLADDVTASVKPDRVVLAKPGGFRIASRESGSAAQASSDLIGLRHLAKLPDLTAARDRAWDRLPRLQDEEEQTARLELARLLLADGLAAEALAVLDAARGAWSPSGERASMALRAAAQLLLGRADEALALFGKAPPATDPELALWRAAAHGVLGDWETGDALLKQAGDVWADYPPRLRLRLGLTAAITLAEIGRVEPALAILENLEEVASSPRDGARLHLVRGMVLAGDARPREAERAFRTAIAEGDTATRILARFLAVDAGLRGGELAPAAVLQSLDAQRLVWRGHPEEARMLTTLGDLQRGEGDVAGALDTWHSVLARQPDQRVASDVIGRMRETLTIALADEGLEDPVAAFSLYRRYGPLLADETGSSSGTLPARLAEAGLPGLATKLMETDLARGSRSPEQRAELARYHLEADDPQAALAALDGAGEEETVWRLRAEALLDLGRPSAALDGLQALPAARIGPLRSEALWRLRDWKPLQAESLELESDPASQTDLLRQAVLRTEKEGREARPQSGSFAPKTPGEAIVAMLEATSAMGSTPGPLLSRLDASLQALSPSLRLLHVP